MRVLAIAACACFFFQMGSAMAADCNKGMLWPFIRSPGDCLTDNEIKAGKTGVFNGALNTNPDVSAIKVEAPPQNTPSGSSNSGWFSGLFGGSSAGNSITAAPSAPANAPAAAGTPTAASLPSNNSPPSGGVATASAAVVSVPAATTGGTFSCSKGYLWPFLRDPGDCLTDSEKQAGRTGVYGGGTGIAPIVPATASAAGTPNSGTAGSTGGTFSCSKGYLWPFLRDPGDCLTDSEKQAGRAGVYGGGTGIAPIVPATASAAGTPNSSTSGETASGTVSTFSCNKGYLWPFLRSPGDCLTDSEKQAGRTGVYGGGTGITQVSQSATNQSPGNQPVTGGANAAPSAPACHKGVFWPFVRNTGDCPTDHGK